MILEKCALNIVVLGEEDSGKSTAIGHLLDKLQLIAPSLLARAEKEVEVLDVPVPQTPHAWLLFRRKHERQHGQTLGLCVRYLQAARHRITITDTPGHRPGVRCIPKAAAGQDAALLVVDSSGGIEALRRALDAQQGVLHEHVYIAAALGVKQFVVALNKMDAVGFEQHTFGQLEAEVRKLVRRAGVSDAVASSMPIIPISAAAGDNLIECSSRMPWYERMQGISLLDALDGCIPTPRPALPTSPSASAQLRMPIQEVVRVSGIGLVCVGRVEQGAVQPGQSVCLLPRGQQAVVKSVEHHCCGVDGSATPGTSVGLALRGPTRRQLSTAAVICDGVSPLPLALRFTARVIMKRDDLFSCKRAGARPDAAASQRGLRAGPSDGSCPVLDMYGCSVQCRLLRVIHLIDKASGKPAPGAAPGVLCRGMVAEVEFAPLGPAYVATRQECAAMGAFVIREKHFVVGYGGVTAVTHAGPGSAAAGQGAGKLRSPAKPGRGKQVPGTGLGKPRGSQRATLTRVED